MYFTSHTFSKSTLPQGYPPLFGRRRLRGFAISRTGWPGKFAACSLVTAVWNWLWRRIGCRVSNSVYLPFTGVLGAAGNVLACN